MSSSLIDRIEQKINRRPQQVAPLHGGMIAEVYRVDLPGGERLVAKAAGGHAATLDIEGYMLRYLAEHSALPVPEVIHSEPTLLLIEYLPGESRLDRSAQTHAAELLAALHNVRAERFGLERDTLIGPLHQPNPWTDSWLEFFRDQRLLYMARETAREGALPPQILARIETLAERLDRWVIELEHPSLIHGDIWTTNVLTQNGRVTGLIDPAIYYAHPEIELAYMTLFGTVTFGADFFRRYQELRPIEPGFKEMRGDLYNLYPLLVHVRLFGGGYVASVDSTLRKFGV
jgi:fructosamine-3-kinase